MPEKERLLKKQASHPVLTAHATFGEKASDKFTLWVGSWTFIFISLIIIIIWILINTAWLVFGRTWDPFPFILLNLALSTLAAIQAPIILMSQNREAQKDRIRAEYDYAVNRKAEREISDIQKQLEKIERSLKK